MTETVVPSTLKRPPQHLIDRFDVSQVRDRTVGDFLTKGYSLALCCKGCKRMIEWTPPQLREKFGARPGLPLADLVPRLSCKVEDGGCGSKAVAVFPHLYDGPWKWPA